MLTDASRLRDFPSMAGMTYLNTAAEGIPPRAVLAALEQYGRDKLLGMDGRKLHEARYASLKERAAAMLGLAADDIGVCSCSSEAYNLAAMALRLRDGDEVVINELEYPAGATPWMMPGCPAKVKLWRHRDFALRTEDLAPLLGPRTRLVTLSLVSFFNGFKVNVPAIAQLVRKHSPALVAVDVTQALGRVELDLRGADLVVSSTHKWILASHGGGVVGVPPERAKEWTVPAGGWFNLANAFDPDRFERAEVKPGAASFSVGMPNYPAVYAVDAALDYIASVGVRAIAVHADPLVRACLDGIKKLPVEVITPDHNGALAGILAFRHPKAAELHRALHAQNIHIMSQAGRLRVAIHGYNTLRDVERFLACLTEAMRRV